VTPSSMSPRASGVRRAIKARQIRSAAKVRSPEFFVDLRRVDVRLDLPLSSVGDLLPKLEAGLAGGTFSTAQVRLGGHEVNAIYLYLGPAQLKRLVARLKVTRLGSRSVAKKRRTR
jgi:hypothetical protein